MDEIRVYIESGILELYVLDQLNEQERKEVEEMAAKYPEIKKELDAIEIAMEKYALSHAITPSADLGNEILNKINNLDNHLDKSFISKSAEQTEPDVRILKSRIKNLKISLAACASLLLVSGVALYIAHDKLDEAHSAIAILNTEKEKFANTASDTRKINAELQEILSMGENPDWKKVKLSGTALDPEANMIVYWHSSRQDVLLDNSKLNLPVNDSNHQYQLWGLVNGKPVDLGVFDVSADGKIILLPMKQISGVQTFAVTLEKRGGSEAPTLSQMIVAGNVSAI